eukprot:29852-Prymnesium_polylepis.4
MGRSNRHTERHAAARAEGTHGEETEETSVRGEVEGLRTGPKIGAHVGAEIAVHDPTGHGSPATAAAQKLVCGEEPRACGRTMQSARMRRHGEPNTPLQV